MSQTVTKLAEGVEGIFIKDTRFNTTLISFNFYFPLEREKVADRALLPFVLTTCGKDYPDFSRLNYKLNKLYGAELGASTEKAGDYQLLKMSVSVIDDKYTLDGEALTDQAAELLCGLLFAPKTENGAFCTEDVEREKRKAIEHIRGEMSDKRVYAKERMIGEMFKDDNYGTAKCGTEEQVSAITGESLYTAWQELLHSAFLRIHVISSALPPKFFENISERFLDMQRSGVPKEFVSRPAIPVNSVNTVTERMDVAQGKLVMGFSCDMNGNDSVSLPLFVLNDLFGGGPYSRLFANVREKMSLCYYCGSTAVRVKGLLSVSCGVESENADKAQQAILEQLEIIKRGEFTDFELESSIKSLVDSLKANNDSQSSIDNWYSVKIANSELFAPEDVAERIKEIDRNTIIETAKGVRLHTVYRLMPKGE